LLRYFSIFGAVSEKGFNAKNYVVPFASEHFCVNVNECQNTRNIIKQTAIAVFNSPSEMVLVSVKLFWFSLNQNAMN